uniref:Cadherin domain-containing protein n=1 Tax=Xiphophorus couchianus TaxID=32473 RepID=A0A3B5L7J7_9TELE
MNSLTGEIKLKALLDFEEFEIYKIDIEASDKGTPPLTGRCRVVVKIKDVNDNSPKIDVTSLSNTISEDSKPGTTISLISVNDEDSGLNGKIISRILNDVPFELKPSYKENMYSLVTKEHLDREKVSLYEILIQASDCGTLNVSVTVLDINDNRPSFSQDVYQVQIYENASVGTIVTRVNATDPDEGTNGEIEYSIANTLAPKIYSIFELEKITGQIKLKAALDFEESEIYKIDIEASDKGTPPLTGRCRVVVKIKDVNDNSPKIDVTSLSNTISEDSKPGTTISLISVTDKDSGLNGKIISRILNDVPFELKPSYKENMYSLKPLDREQSKKLVLFVTAKDGGKPPRSGTLNVSVTVLDINDNRPSFSQDVYQVQIYENASVGTIVTRVNATDPDEGTNGEIEYSIAKTLAPKIYSIFELEKITGQIKLKAALDFEESEIYKIDIEASDKGTPPLTGRCRVVVKIKDVNDNSPKIDVTSLSNTISEDSKPGTTISLISVTDKDSGLNGKIISRILNDVPFELKPSYKENMYSLVTKEHLDREKVSLYEILIQASDCGNPPLSTVKTLSVQVSDVNDNKNNAAGATVLSVSATDIDMNENAAISYYILREGRKDDVTAFLNINSENGQIAALRHNKFKYILLLLFGHK